METGRPELEVLLEFSRAANEAATVDAVLREIARAVREGFGYDRAAVFLAEKGDPARMRGAIATNEAGHEVPIPQIIVTARTDPRWVAVLAGEQDYLFTEDAARDIQLQLPSGKPVSHHVVVPLRTPKRLLGSLAADNGFSDRPITDEKIRTLLAFGTQAAVALQNVQLIEELRDSEERLRTLVTSLTETLYTVRIQNGVVTPSFYSPQIETLTGYTADEALSTPDFWRTVTYPDDRLKVDRAKDDLSKGAPLALEYRILHRCGEVRWVLDTPVPASSSGSAVVVNGSILDITDRKMLEDRLRRAQRMETVGTLAGGVAHNFNNYLQMVILQVDDAQAQLQMDHPATPALCEAQSILGMAAKLAHQLLTFGKKRESDRDEMVLDDLVAQTLPLLQPTLGKSIRVEHLPDPDVTPVVVDAAQLQQVLINLCINARDAIRGEGVITVRTQNVVVKEHDRRRPPGFPAGNYVRLQVHDTGIGMDATTQERIFEPFFTTKPVGRGTGLGLAVTYTIVTDHGGWIDVESHPGKGTLFSLYLPSAEVARQAAPAPAAETPERIALIVDPVEQEREKLARLLESLGVDVLTAEGVSDAMAVVWDAGERLDAVFCSARLVGVDVAQLAESLRDSGGAATLIITGDRSDTREVQRSGIPRDLSVLTRPYSAAKVAEALHIPLPAEPAVRHSERRRNSLSLGSSDPLR